MCMRLPPGRQATLGPEALLADLSGLKPAFRCIAPWQAFSVPSSGSWYAISSRRFLMQLGLRDLIDYRLEGFGNRTFRLGFRSSMKLQIACVQGFQRWIKGRDCLTCDMLRADLYDMMRSAVKEEVRQALPALPTYENCVAEKRVLEKRIANRLFELLFDQGMSMILEEFRIEEFAQPTITIRK